MSSSHLTVEIKAHLAAGEMAEALILLRSAVISYPGSFFFAEKLAIVANQTGEVATCRNALDHCRRLSGDSRALRTIEPELLVNEGDLGAAEAAAEKLVVDYPRDEECLRAAISVLERICPQNLAPAWRGLESIGRISPNELIRAIRCLRASGDHGTAHRLVEELLVREPHHREGNIERVALWLDGAALGDRSGLEAFITLVNVDLAGALSLLPSLTQSQHWEPLLILIQRSRAEGVTGEAFQMFVGPLEQEAERAERHGLYDASAVLHVILAMVARPAESAAAVAKARLAIEAMVQQCRELIKSGDTLGANQAIDLILSLGEAGAPFPVALADLADQMGDTHRSARVLLLCFREAGEERFLNRAMELISRHALVGDALQFFISLPGLAGNRPIVARTGIALAARADAALAAARTLDPDLVVAAQVVLGQLAPREWPTRGAKSYTKLLREAMKAADLSGNADAAIPLAEAGVALDPKMPYPYKVLARLYRGRGFASKARDCLMALCELEPENPDHVVRFARHCRMTRNCRGLVDILVSSVSWNPTHEPLLDVLDKYLIEPVG
jgi:hypothetical protein